MKPLAQPQMQIQQPAMPSSPVQPVSTPPEAVVSQSEPQIQQPSVLSLPAQSVVTSSEGLTLVLLIALIMVLTVFARVILGQPPSRE
uniref:Uncharacterized protein n=1 Tax=Cyanothece sp. (strain PCC 7425 / ATCC 29141) TaxID=395961 RepID=B8HW04_CYAP4